MKSLIFVGVIFLSIAYQKCAMPPALTIPACILEKIEQIKKQPRWNPPATVEEYEYNGKRVFLFSADCCDKYIEAFDENCNYLCAPGGGFSGKGDGKCADFKEKARWVKLVWKDER